MDSYHLTLEPQEKAYLESLVQTDLEETRVEVRRTDTPSLHDELLKRETMIRGILAKLREGKPALGPAGR
jgi:hypothetical protein